MGGKKIGIITFHNADNLGAVLQAYALQSTLEDDFGKVAEIIDYRCPQIDDNRRREHGVKAIALHFYYFIKSRAFLAFRKRYLKLSQVYSPETIARSVDKYDIFITGSDQVWNYECSGWDNTYFLNFVPDNKKKYSYAASIGNYKYTDQERRMVCEFLQSYSGISVRENSALQELNSMGVTRAELSPDPVMLLTKERWMRIMPKRLCKQKYVFVYLIQQDVNVVRSAQRYAKNHNCKIISNKKSIEFILHCSPTDFLSWIYYADCVFTNSFHGTAFSLIFEKPLAVDVELINGEVNKRVKEILEIANATQCILDKEQNEIIHTPTVDDALCLIREKALGYLEMVCRNF